MTPNRKLKIILEHGSLSMLTYEQAAEYTSPKQLAKNKKTGYSCYMFTPYDESKQPVFEWCYTPLYFLTVIYELITRNEL